MMIIRLSDGIVLDVNESCLSLMGFSRNEVMGVRPAVLGLVESTEKLRALEEELETTGSVGNHATVVRTRSGALLDVIASLERMGEGDGTTVLLTIVDVSEMRRIQEELASSREHYRVLTETMKDVVWTLDLETGYFTYVSPSVERLRGYTPEEVISSPASDALTAESSEYLRTVVRTRMEENGSGPLLPSGYFTDELEQPCRNGGTVWTEVVSHPRVNPATGHIEVFGVSRDISERKRMEQDLREAVAQKETLLGELQHRVKNSLAMVSSLLHLGAGRLSDTDAGQIFSETSGRVKSVAEIYDRLDLASGNMRVNLKGYFEHLAQSVHGACCPPGKLIRLELHLADVGLDARTAVPLGLVLNELLTNAMKYAFVDVDRGAIRIDLEEKDGGVLLQVSDTGKGFPVGFDPEAAGGTGLLLVRSLVNQIHGTLEFTPAGGVNARIGIPGGRQTPTYPGNTQSRPPA